MLRKLYNKAMEYKYRFIIYLILLAITLSLAIALQVIVFPIETPKNGSEATNTLSECMLLSPNIPYYPDMYTLGSLGHETLINCLIKYESNGNERAVNPEDVDGRPKYGLLQFDSRTFKHYCVDRYELPNDIWNGDIQKTCCDNMISENWGNIYHWGTINLCIK